MAADSQTGHSRQTIRQVVRGAPTDAFRVRMSFLEPYLAKLDADWSAGCRNGAELWRRLKAPGFGGSLRVVTEWATRRRRSERDPDGRPGKVPSARTIARLMTQGRDQLLKNDAITIATIEGAVPGLVTARDRIDQFHAMIRGRTGADLDEWISDAADDLLSSFPLDQGSAIAAAIACRSARIPAATSRAGKAIASESDFWKRQGYTPVVHRDGLVDDKTSRRLPCDPSRIAANQFGGLGHGLATCNSQTRNKYPRPSSWQADFVCRREPRQVDRLRQRTPDLPLALYDCLASSVRERHVMSQASTDGISSEANVRH